MSCLRRCVGWGVSYGAQHRCYPGCCVMSLIFRAMLLRVEYDEEVWYNTYIGTLMICIYHLDNLFFLFFPSQYFVQFLICFLLTLCCPSDIFFLDISYVCALRDRHGSSCICWYTYRIKISRTRETLDNKKRRQDCDNVEQWLLQQQRNHQEKKSSLLFSPLWTTMLNSYAWFFLVLIYSPQHPYILYI